MDHIINIATSAFVGGVFVVIAQWLSNHSNEHQSEVDIAPDIAGQLRQALSDNRQLSIENIHSNEKIMKTEEKNAQLRQQIIDNDRKHADEMLELRKEHTIEIEKLQHEIQYLKNEIAELKGSKD